MSSSKLVKGTFILTIGAILSKIIGLAYTIPFSRMLGDTGGLELYAYAYNAYTIFICIATAGFPSAVSKFTAKYNAIGEYNLSRKMFHTGQYVMLGTGILAFAILYAIAPIIAPLYGSERFTAAEIITVVRAVSFALLIVPSISIFRGYFQGHGDMIPTSVSQVIEQLARVLFLLGGVYYAMYVIDKETVLAARLATFGAFVGALFALLVLVYYWIRKKTTLDQLLEQDAGQVKLTIFQMFKEIFLTSIPFIFISITMPLFQLVDNLTVNHVLKGMGLAAQSSAALSAMNVQAQQLVVIPLTLATAFQVAIIPNISAAVSAKDYGQLKRNLNETFTVLLLIMIPATLGMSLFSEPLFTLFYGHKEIGITILRTFAPMMIFLSLMTVSAAVLQGMNRQRFTMKSLAVGLVVKAILAVPFLRFFGAQGAVISAGFAYLTIAMLNIQMIKKSANYSFKKIFRRSLLICLLSLFMLVVMALALFLLKKVFDVNDSIGSLWILVCSVPFGIVLYFFLSYRTGLFQSAFGSQAERILIKLRLKKS